MSINTKYRTEAAEIMDDFSLEGETLRDALDKIAAINRLLGGNKLTLQGVRTLLSNIGDKRTLTIIDVGCGNGDMLRSLANFGYKNNIDFKLIGIDANNFTINHAKALSVDYKNINYRCENVFNSSIGVSDCDIVLCTLTLHHFKDDEIIQLLNIFNKQARIGIVINDLHRSIMAYRLFQLICFVFSLNKMSKEDGLVSILRGFKKEELVRFSRILNFKKYSIHWRWAFRYQWIITKV